MRISQIPTHLVTVGTEIAVPIGDDFISAVVLAIDGNVITVPILPDFTDCETRWHFPRRVMVINK